MVKKREHLVKRQVQDKNGITRTVYVRPDSNEDLGKHGKVAVAPTRRGRLNEDDLDDIEQEVEPQEEEETGEPEAPEWTPVEHKPKFEVDQEWGTKSLSVDSVKNATNIVRHSMDSVEFDEDRAVVAKLSNRWNAVISASAENDTGRLTDEEAEQVRTMFSDAGYRERLAENIGSDVSRRDMDSGMSLIEDTLQDEDKGMQTKVYAALSRRRLLMERTAELSAKIEEQEDFLRSLADDSTSSKYTYDVQPDEGMKVAFTPYRSFNEDLARQYLTEEEIEQAEYTPEPRIDPKVVARLVQKSDPSRYEAMRNQGTTRMGWR